MKDIKTIFICFLIFSSFGISSLVTGLLFISNPDQAENITNKSQNSVENSQKKIIDFSSWSRTNIKIAPSGELYLEYTSHTSTGSQNLAVSGFSIHANYDWRTYTATHDDDIINEQTPYHPEWDSKTYAMRRITDYGYGGLVLEFNNPNPNRQYYKVEYFTDVWIKAQYNQKGRWYVTDKNGESVLVTDQIPYQTNTFPLLYRNSHDELSESSSLSALDSQLGDIWVSKVRQRHMKYCDILNDDVIWDWDYAYVKWYWYEYKSSGTVETSTPITLSTTGDIYLHSITYDGLVPIGTNVIIEYNTGSGWQSTSKGKILNELTSQVEIRLTLNPESTLKQKTPKITEVTINYGDTPHAPLIVDNDFSSWSTSNTEGYLGQLFLDTMPLDTTSDMTGIRLSQSGTEIGWNERWRTHTATHDDDIINEQTPYHPAWDSKTYAMRRITDYGDGGLNLIFNNPNPSRQYYKVKYFTDVWIKAERAELGEWHVTSEDSSSLLIDDVITFYNNKDPKLFRKGIYINSITKLDKGNSILGGIWPSTVNQIHKKYCGWWVDDVIWDWDYATVDWYWYEYYSSGTAEKTFILNATVNKYLHSISFEGIVPPGTNVEIQYNMYDVNTNTWSGWQTAEKAVTLNAEGSQVKVKLFLMSEATLKQLTPNVWKVKLNYGDTPLAVGADFTEITVPFYDAGNWIETSIGRKPHPGNTLYVYQPITIKAQISNPQPKTIKIRDSYIQFICDPNYLNETEGITRGIFEGYEIASGVTEYDEITFAGFQRIHFTSWDIWDDLDLKIILEFTAEDLETGTGIDNVSIEKVIKLAKPPKPKVEFIGFVGKSGSFEPTYKPDGILNSFFASVKVTNDAFIPFIINNLDFNYLPEDPYNDYDHTHKLRIFDYLSTGIGPVQIAPEDSKICNLPLEVTPFGGQFFMDTSLLFDLLLGGVLPVASESIEYWAKVVAEAGGQISSTFIKLAKVLAWAAVIYQGAMVLLASITSTQDNLRQYKFTVELYGSFETYDTNEVLYAPTIYSTSTATNGRIKLPIPATDTLDLTPSKWQWDYFGWGIGLRVAAGVAYGFAAVLPPPWSLIPLGIGISLEIASDACWSTANGDIPADLNNYNKVITPSYPNLTHPEPTTSFEYAMARLYNDSAIFVTNLQVYNQTISRRKGALEAGDNESLLLQDKALYNYSILLAESSRKVSEDLSILINEYNKTASQINNNISTVISNLSKDGLSEETRQKLRNLGLNETEIEYLNDIMKNSTFNKQIHIQFNNTANYLVENISRVSQVFDHQIEKILNQSEEILEESIKIETTEFGIEILTASEETLNLLKFLNDTMMDFENQGKLSLAFSTAESLKELALETASITRNTTYLIYADEADLIIREYKKVVKIDLIPYFDKVSVIPGETQELEILIMSTGSPTGSYTVKANSTWIQPQAIQFEVEEFKSTSIVLKINPEKYYGISPGIYPIELLLYKKGTDIQKVKIIQVQILPYYEISVSIVPKDAEIDPGEIGTFLVTIQNRGNVPDIYDIEFEAIDFGMEYEAIPTKIPDNWLIVNDICPLLNPGEIFKVNITLALPSDWKGMEDTIYSFIFKVMSQTDLSISSLISGSLIAKSTPQSKLYYIKYQLENLGDKIRYLAETEPVIFGKNPMQRANSLSKKISETITYLSLLTDKSCIEAYNKLLHDIKSKLTGLKEDENGITFGNGVFKQPWITDENYQQYFNKKCNNILENIQNLISSL
ncbi:MAG: COG1470 family protein [Candidatus Helarchaeota archaeon]